MARELNFKQELVAAFGQPIASFQNTKFVLAEVRTEIEVTTPFVDQCVMRLNAGDLTVQQSAARQGFDHNVPSRWGQYEGIQNTVFGGLP